ncbi:MAG: glycerophosphodiester phosphodiesterase [Firmicutes bacterium]|nr:glycerophosphodiester phosphodiesterase [Bacillota bacterium]
MKTKIIAHRGASGYAPENTIESFKKALILKSDGIELDVHLTKDKKLVVCHDEKVNRTTNGKGYIKDLNLKELKKLDAGSWFDKKFKNVTIPTLEEVLDLIKDKNIFLNIELKNNIIFYEDIEKKVIDTIKKYNIKNCIISSFNHYSLLKVKKIDSNIKTGILYFSNLVDPFDYALKLEAFSIHPSYNNVDSNLMKESINKNIKINTFTVNDKNKMKFLRNKVNGIITNYPDIAKDIIKSTL